MSATHSRKRPAHESLVSQPPAKGRPTNAVQDSKVPFEAVSRQTARTMLRNHPPLKVNPSDERGFYRTLIETPIENWCAEDEAAVISDWNNSEARYQTKDLSLRHSDLFVTWKISLRLYHETPVTILSLFTSLRYQPVSTSDNVNTVIYSATFSRKLSELMVHPCWEQKTTLLTLALRWTVICRLDDRRVWELNRTYGCAALKALSRAIEECKDSRVTTSYHEMHEAARDAVSGQLTRPSVLSDLLFNIGQAVSQERSCRPPVDSEYQTDSGFEVLPVTLWDLKVLAKAVSSTQFRTDWNYSTAEAFEAWKAERKGNEAPAQTKLPLLYELAHLDLLRHRVDLRRNVARRSESGESREDILAPERRISETLSDRRVVPDGDSDSLAHEFSTIHRTSSPSEQGYDEMTDFLDGGVDSDGSVAAPLKAVLSPPHEPTQPVIASTPMEDRPFQRQRRYRALVDGEETEDEQEDLQRNQRHQLGSNQRTVSDRPVTALGHRFGDRTSQFDFKYTYRQQDSAKRSSTLRICPPPVSLASRGSGPPSGQLTMAGDGTRNTVIEETNSSLNRIENLNRETLNINQSQAHDAHQSVAHPMDRLQYRAGNTSTPEAAPIAVSAELDESDLVRDLRAQVSKLLEKNAQLLETNKELSDKVKYQKFAISDLHQDVAQEKAGRETERKRADDLETVL